jgi:hypothetical protein
MDLFAADGVLNGIGGVDGQDSLRGTQLSGLIVFLSLRCSGRVNHRDRVRRPHLPGGKSRSGAPAGRKLSEAD